MPKADLLQMTPPHFTLNEHRLQRTKWATWYNLVHDFSVEFAKVHVPIFFIKVHTSVREHLLHFSGWNRLVGEISSGGASDPVYWWGRWFRTSSIWYTWTNFIGGPRYFGRVSILVQLNGPMLLVPQTLSGSMYIFWYSYHTKLN